MTFVEPVIRQMLGLAKPQVKFMLAYMSALFAFCGRATMENLSRYGAGSARRIARWLRKPFSWSELNLTALRVAEITAHTLCAAFDSSFLPKSGKHSWGLGYFYNGCASRAERGLELNLLALVDLDEHTAYALDADLTPNTLPENQNRIDHYLGLIERQAPNLLLYTRHLLADGFFAKAHFIDGLEKLGLHLVSKLRHDTKLRYLYTGPRREGRGRPKCYDGVVDFKDLSRMQPLGSVEPGVELFTAVVNHVHFGRNLRVVVVVNTENGKRRHVVLFSTDLALSGLQIYQQYSARFQIEFIFRDAKQHLGLGHAQVRDQKGLEFSANASLAAVNLARLEDRQMVDALDSRVISIASAKRKKYNQMLLERFCSTLDLDLNSIKLHPAYDSLCAFGSLTS